MSWIPSRCLLALAAAAAACLGAHGRSLFAQDGLKAAAGKRSGDGASSADTRPNVVLIYGDDVGYADLGCYGATKIPTPNLDRLASQGLRFTDAHCSAATCTPSRFSLLSGVHGFRRKIRVLPPNAPLTIPTDWLTLPKVFQRAGYRTAIVGKWHLGLGQSGEPVDWNGDVKPGPLEVGFDVSFLLPSTNDRVPCVYLDGHRVLGLDPKDPLFVGRKRPASFAGTEYPNGKIDRDAMTYYPSSHGHDNSVIGGIGRIGFQWGGQSAVWDDEKMADVFVDRAKAFLADHSRKKAPSSQQVERAERQPFFLFFSSQDIHVPRTPHPRFRGKSQLGFRGDAMVQLDWAAGAILKALDEHDLARETLVIFSSDNGPVYDDGYVDGTTVRTSTAEVDRGHDGSGPYRGGKYQIYEGGTRVPMLVRWPDKIAVGTSDALFGQIDLLASFAKMLDVPLAKEDAIDSRNALAVLLGKDEVGVPYLVEEAGTLALRHGPWKYVQARRRRGSRQLYDLRVDRGERRDLANQDAERVARFDELLHEVVEGGVGLRQLSERR
ncbi:MAG: arylsulfatase [Planctomycetota bacterium]